jgi:hypothetical protein
MSFGIIWFILEHTREWCEKKDWIRIRQCRIRTVIVEFEEIAVLDGSFLPSWVFVRLSVIQ